MSDNVSKQYLIEIKTLLDSGGIDAAKTKIDELASSTDDASKKNDSNAKNLGSSRTEMEKTARAAFALRMAANGSTEGFRGLVGAALNVGEAFGALVARISMVGAAFVAGWTIGTKIREALIPMSELDEAALSVKEHLSLVPAALDAISAHSMNDLTKKIEEMSLGYERALTAARSLREIADMKEDTTLARLVAQLDLSEQKGEITPASRAAQEAHLRSMSATRKLENEKKLMEFEASSYETQVNEQSGLLQALKDRVGTSRGSVQSMAASLKDSKAIEPKYAEMLSADTEKERSAGLAALKLAKEEALKAVAKAKSDRLTLEGSLNASQMGLPVPIAYDPQLYKEADDKIKKAQSVVATIDQLFSAINVFTSAQSEYQEKKPGLVGQINTAKDSLTTTRSKLGMVDMRRDTIDTQYSANQAKSLKEEREKNRQAQLEQAKKDFEFISEIASDPTKLDEISRQTHRAIPADPREFPGVLMQLNKKMTGLEIDGLNDLSPELKARKTALIQNDYDKQLKDKLQAIAITTAQKSLGEEQDLAPITATGQAQRIKDAETTLKEVKAGNVDAIGRLLGLIESMSADSQAMLQRLNNLESQTKSAPGFQ